MSVLTYCTSVSRRIRKRLRELAADTRGVAAVEFALVLPLLLSLYFVTIEVSRGIETNKKVGRVANTVADLVTQQRTTTSGELKAMMMIGKALLKPYGRSAPTINLTAIEITDEDAPKTKVAWRSKLDALGSFEAVAPKNETTTVPKNLEIRGTFLIRVQADLGYKPVIAWTGGDSSTGSGVLGGMFQNGVMNMQELYYLRPRMSQTITCSDCTVPK